MTRTLSGSVSLRGDGLTLHGMEIDEILSKAEEAKKLQPGGRGRVPARGPAGLRGREGYRYGGPLPVSHPGGNPGSPGSSPTGRCTTAWPMPGMSLSPQGRTGSR